MSSLADVLSIKEATDEELFLEILNRHNIDCIPLSTTHDCKFALSYTLNEGDHALIDGYSNFYSDWIFDEHGKLLQIGIWE